MREVWIPVEVIERDLTSKLILANALLKRGFKVFIGRRALVERLSKYLENSIYLSRGLGLDERAAKLFYRLRQNDNLVASLDVEGGLAIDSVNTYRALRVNPALSPCLDVIFAWSFVEENIIRNDMRMSSDKVVVSGNPGFDLCRYDEKDYYVDEHTKAKSVAPYVLVALSCCIFHKLGDNFWEKQKDKYSSDAGFVFPKSVVDGWVEADKKRRESNVRLIEFVSDLAELLPSINIIVRPHPDEDLGRFRATYEWSENENVRIQHGGSVVPWILNASTLVHCYSTTSLEACLRGVPSVCCDFEGLPDIVHSKVGGAVTTLTDLVWEVEACTGTDTLDDSKGLLKNIFGGLEERSASDIIADELLARVHSKMEKRTKLSRKLLFSAIRTYIFHNNRGLDSVLCRASAVEFLSSAKLEHNVSVKDVCYGLISLDGGCFHGSGE